MAITLFGTTSTPADNGAQAGPGPVAVTPPASMLAGDLPFLVGLYRDVDVGGNTGIPNLFNGSNVAAEHGGQRWSSAQPVFKEAVEPFLTFKVHYAGWTGFNGAWAANPSLTVDTGVEALSAVMPVFRPTSAGKRWVPNIGPVTANFAAPTGPNFTVTVPSITTLTKHGSQSHVILAGVATGDANTWGNISGTGWTFIGHFRNLNCASPDQSLALMYKIQTASGASLDVTLDQLTLGGDAGVSFIMAMTEVDAPVAAAAGAGTRVQSGKATSTAAGTTLTASPAAAFTAGNTIVGYLNTEAPGVNGNTHDVSTTTGQELYIVKRETSDRLFDESVLYWHPNLTGAPTGVTLTHGGADSVLRAMIVHEVAGGTEIDALGGRRWTGQDAFSPEVISAYPTVTPSVAGCYCFGGAFAATAGNTDWYAAIAPWLEREVLEPPPAGDSIISSFDFVQDAPAAVTFEATADLGADHLPMFLILRPAVAGGPFPPWRPRIQESA